MNKGKPSLDKCPICQCTDLTLGPVTYTCTQCGRIWVHNEEGWETIPQQVEVDPTKLKEGANYSDAVKPAGTMAYLCEIHQIYYIKYEDPNVPNGTECPRCLSEKLAHAMEELEQAHIYKTWEGIKDKINQQEKISYMRRACGLDL